VCLAAVLGEGGNENQIKLYWGMVNSVYFILFLDVDVKI